MRIIAGKNRAKKLLAPQGKTTRPTSDKIRQAIFNTLESLLKKQGRTFCDMSVFDCFAGTGALGLEAVSRGATRLFCAEKDKEALACLHQNIKSFQKEANIECFSDALNLTKANVAVDLVFLDPPYEKGLVPLALKELLQNGWLDENSLCVIEIKKGEFEANPLSVLPQNFEMKDRRTYGKTEILMAQVKRL